MYHVFKANKPNLLAIAQAYAVEVDPKDTLKVLQAKIEADGVTPADVANLHPEFVLEMHPTEAETPVVAVVTTPQAIGEDAVDRKNLVKMTRRNASYEIRGHKYTQDQPFNLVNDEDATYLVEYDKGFSMASPSELKAFFG